MRIEVPYGAGLTALEIDESRIDGVVSPNVVEIGDEAATLRRAIGNPIDSPAFDDFLSGADDVLVVVNDTTRPTPTAAVLE